MKLFEPISAVQVDIIICYRKKFRHYSIGNTICSCSLRISGENAVQVLAILIDQTHGAMLKAADVDQWNDDHISLQFFRLKFFCKFHCCLDSHILRTVYSCRDQDRRSVFHSAYHSCRHCYAVSCDLNFPLCLLSFFNHPVINFDHWLFPFSFFIFPHF